MPAQTRPTTRSDLVASATARAGGRVRVAPRDKLVEAHGVGGCEEVIVKRPERVVGLPCGSAAVAIDPRVHDQHLSALLEYLHVAHPRPPDL